MDFIIYTKTFPKKGETILATSFEMGFGGKGANQAVAAAKLGADVTMVTKVGDDYFGTAMVENFKTHHVRTEYISRVAGVSSGVAIIIVDQHGHNRILVAQGANQFVDENSVDAAIDEIKKTDILLLQLEIPLNTVYYAISVAKKYKITTILNAAPAVPLCLEKIRGVFMLVVNEVELAAMANRRIKRFSDIVCSARQLIKAGIPQVIVTLGEKGALLCTRTKAELISTFKVTPVDTTGAGDAFVGSLAVFLTQEKQIQSAIKLANYYATFSTLKRGTQKSFLTKHEFKKRLYTLKIN